MGGGRSIRVGWIFRVWLPVDDSAKKHQALRRLLHGTVCITRVGRARLLRTRDVTVAWELVCSFCLLGKGSWRLARAGTAAAQCPVQCHRMHQSPLSTLECSLRQASLAKAFQVSIAI